MNKREWEALREQIQEESQDPSNPWFDVRQDEVKK